MAEEREHKENISVITADMTIAVILLLLFLALFGAFLGNIFQWYANTVDWFYSNDWKRIFTMVQWIITILDALLIAFVIFTIRKLQNLQKQPLEEKESLVHIVPIKEEIRTTWEEIKRLGNSDNPSDWNMAVLRADALFNDILGDLGYQGDTMADRLKIVDPTKLKSVDQIWSAHRLRNLIAHDPVEQHTRETIIHAIRTYEQAMKELEMLETT